MPDTGPAVLLHPVRLRIVQAFASPSGSRRLTVQELAALLDDVPQTSLYRHVQALYRAGVLAIARSRRVRGTIERTYVLAAGGGRLPAGEFATASREDHLRYFNAFLGSLAAEFARYLRREKIDPIADHIGYQTLVLELSDDELADFERGLRDLVTSHLRRPTAPDRRRRLLSIVTLPAGELPTPPPPEPGGGEAPR
jgi:DNA-binding transcriptional ArsR family regulator